MRGERSHKNRILVGTPIHRESCRYLKCLFDVWEKWDKTNMDFFLVYNGVIDLRWINFLKRSAKLSGIKNLQIEFQATGHLDGWGALTHAQNTIRKKVIQGDYKYLLFHEASRVPEPCALSKLLKFKKHVIGALYKDTYHPGYYCVYQFNAKRNLHIFEPYKDIDKINAPKRVDAVGFGFTLISREILERVSFHSCKFASDTYFFESLKCLNIPVYAAPVFVENLKINKKCFHGVGKIWLKNLSL